MNEKLTIHKLRLLGFRVEITHRRIYKYLDQGNVKTTAPLAEFEAIRNLTDAEIICGRQPKGGSTTMKIFGGATDNLIWETTATCRSDENFSHKIGIEVALKRLEEWSKTSIQKTVNGMLKSNGLKIATYSKEMDKTSGHVIWRGIGGNEVKCTDVSSDIDFTMNMMKRWPDMQVVGFVREDGFICRPSWGMMGSPKFY